MNAMEKRGVSLLTLIALLAAGAAHAAGADLGQSAKQATNWTAIIMFGVFVAGTLWITKWAAAKTKSASDFYTAGGGITGFQNGLAIAGDYMSAASFLGISAAVMASGYDGLIYSIGFLVGWPIITFLMAERLRNLGKFTFADVAGYRFQQGPIRAFAASGTLVVVAFYLIAQMVGAGQLIKLLFGLEYWMAVVIVGALMMVYVLFGGMTATTWVQIIKAVLLLGGAGLLVVLILARFDFQPVNLFQAAVARYGEGVMQPGGLVANPLDAVSLGLALMFGTAGLPHILMRFFTVPNAKEARKSVFYATGFIGFFFLVVMVLGFAAIVILLFFSIYTGSCFVTCGKLFSTLFGWDYATMMAIGANQIHMGPMAYLSAVDTSLTHDLSPLDRDNDRVSVSLNELTRVVKLWRNNTEDKDSNPYKSLFEHVHPLVIGAVDRAESLSIMLCEELLSYHITDKKIGRAHV